MAFNHKVVDGHFHLYNWYSSVDGRDFKAVTDEYRANRNFAAMNINALPSVKWDVGNNIIAALYKLWNPDVFAHGGLVYESYPMPDVVSPGFDPLTQYQELMAIGFDGIKMLETKPTELKAIGKFVDDEVYEPFFAAAEKDGTHMIWHVVDPENNWDINKVHPGALAAGWFYGDGTYPSQEEIYQQVFRVLDRHPDLKVTFAHFFFMSRFTDRLEEVFRRFPNANVDLTPGVEMYGAFGERREFFRDFFIRYADHISYGTDNSDHATLEANLTKCDTVYEFLATDKHFDIWDYQFQGLALPDETVEMIASGNFFRRVADKPKAIDPKALKEYIAKYRHLIRDDRIRANVDEQAKLL